MGQNTIWELGIQIVKHGGTFLQLEKANPKMGFIKRQNMALAKRGFKDQIGLIWGEKTWRRRGEEEEEEKKRKKEDSSQDQAKVWKLNLSMDLWNFKGFVWLIACLQKLGF